MQPLDLNVPATIGNATAVQLQQIGVWLDGLPKLNEGQVFDAVLERLQDVNRLASDPAQRSALAGKFLGMIEYLAENLCRRCETLEFPAAAAEQTQSAQIQRLLEEMAVSYKRVLVDLAAVRPGDAAHDLARDAVFQALRLLGLRVLQGYIVYQDAPAGVWGELHRLYRHAERIDVATVRVEHLADQSAGDVYRRVLLLALANPFHLMQGEARSAYERLAKWALAARIRHPAEFPPEAPETFYAKRCFVDLDGDAPPCFGLRPGQAPPRDARILELRPVAQVVEDRIRQTVLKGQSLSMRERLERDMLRRLRNAWSGRPERAAERSIQTGEVHVVGGLRAIHHALSGGADFNPERDEIALHGNAFRSASKLSLVPLEDEPWRQQDTRSKLEQGVLKPRGYGFDTESKEQDVWERAEHVSTAKSTQLEERLDSRLLNRQGRIRQHDISASGIGAHCADGSGLRFRVGDLVRIGAEAVARDSSGLGVVCWLRQTAPGEMDIGLNRIEGAATALAVRGVEGVGAGGDYHRALGLHTDAARMVIVPAGSFELGSHILYNARVALGILALQRIVHSTKAFTLYTVESVEMTPERREAVLSGLYKLLERSTQ